MAFLEGYGIGFAMIIFIGPVFFTLLKSALQYGFRGGMMVALGIFISDIVCVAFCSFGAIPFFRNPDNQHRLALAGSIILFGLGLKYIFKPAVFTSEILDIKAHHYPTLFSKGFVVNFVNPFVFVVWIGVVVYGRTKFGSNSQLVLFLSAALLAIFTTDSLKVIFANYIKDWLKPSLLMNVYRIIGIVLIGFGIRMLWWIF